MKFVRKMSKIPEDAIPIGMAAGLLLGLSWLVPGSLFSAVVGWGAAFGLVAAARLKSGATFAAVLVGVSSHILAFYWFFPVLKSFTESNFVVAALLTIPFLLWHVLQFGLFAVLYRALPSSLGTYGLRAPLAWVSLEWVWPRLFPWALGNTQIGFLNFVQLAEVTGTYGISFVMLYFAENCYGRILNRGEGLRFRVQAVLFLSILLFGHLRVQSIDSETSGVIQVGVVQPGIFTQDVTGERMELGGNLSEYSDAIADKVDLIVWPERALKSTIHESIGHRNNDPRLPRFSTPVPFITGANTYRPPSKTFNSAMYIERDGRVPVPYHKRTLMPFGEYLPFPRLFNILGLSTLAPKSMHDAGSTPTIFSVPLRANGNVVKVAPLICVEDLQPKLSTLAVSLGASVIVDLSAGGWSEVSLPSYQHQALATMRAIETRRSLIRLSGKGPTSLIDPTGKIHQLMSRSEKGARIASVPLTSSFSFFPITGEGVPVATCLVVLLLLVIRVSRFCVGGPVQEAIVRD